MTHGVWQAGVRVRDDSWRVVSGNKANWCLSASLPIVSQKLGLKRRTGTDFFLVSPKVSEHKMDSLQLATFSVPKKITTGI